MYRPIPTPAAGDDVVAVYSTEDSSASRVDPDICALSPACRPDAWPPSRDFRRSGRSNLAATSTRSTCHPGRGKSREHGSIATTGERWFRTDLRRRSAARSTSTSWSAADDCRGAASWTFGPRKCATHDRDLQPHPAEMHETARGCMTGALGSRRCASLMRYACLQCGCLSAAIRAIRSRARMSQAVFAAVLNPWSTADGRSRERPAVLVPCHRSQGSKHWETHFPRPRRLSLTSCQAHPLSLAPV